MPLLLRKNAEGAYFGKENQDFGLGHVKFDVSCERRREQAVGWICFSGVLSRGQDWNYIFKGCQYMPAS